VPLDLLALLRPQPDFVWREIHWPSELPTEAAAGLLRQLATDRFVRLLALEIEASGGEMTYRLGVATEAVRRVEQLFIALVPQGAITAANRAADLEHGWRVVASTPHRPFDTTRPEPVARAVLAGLVAARRDERVVVQWLLGPTHAPRPVSTSTSSAAVEPWWRPLLGGTSSDLDPEHRRAL
jgi:hypothetical protein